MERERRVAYVYLHDVHVLFSSLPFGSRGLRAQRLLSRKKAISIFGTKEFFFFGKGEYRFLNMYWERVEWE